jgi:hypothetical protein
MKAKSFAGQYIRTSLCDKIDFYLFAVQADDYHLYTAEQWEAELFRQIQELIDSLVQSGRLDSDTCQPGSQPNLSQEIEDFLMELETPNEEGEQHKFAGKRYTFRVNPRKSEVRVAKDTNGKSLLNEYLQILENLCKKEPNFPKFVECRKEIKKSRDVEENEDSDDDDEGSNNGNTIIAIIFLLF